MGMKFSVGRILILALALVSSSAFALPPVERGYIEMADGVGLRYSVQLPDGPGPFPVLLQYQGYGAGSEPNDNGMVLLAPRLLEKGFAILGVNLRGTGCSEGNFDLFEKKNVSDGYTVVQWAAKQKWSNGDVAMVGLSYPAMTQWMVAPSRPPALKALMPWSGMTDLYRDVGYPGGIFNQSFALAWTGIQKDGHQYLARTEIQAGNSRCIAAIAGQNKPDRIVFVEAQRRSWADDFIYTRFVPEGSLRDISIPTLVTHAWQDEQIGSRTTKEYEQLESSKTWMIYGNGAHGFGLGTQFVVEEAEKFLLHFLKGQDNGFEQHPHVQIVHESDYKGAHRWITSHERWPVAATMAEIYLNADGSLSSKRPDQEGKLDYIYPLPAPSMTAALAAEQENKTYQIPVPPNGAAVFTSPPLTHDLEILGSLRADLWLSSTASDTDVQVSVTEVRPDGQEQFVQRGWLRASQRKMDVRKNTANFPYQTHVEADVQPLAPNTPTLLNVEVWAVGHVFRKGSSLRISVEAPLSTTGFRLLQIVPTPAMNAIHTGGATLSRVTMPVIGGAKAPVDFPACGSLINQPCRSNQGTVPAGVFSVPAASEASPEAASLRQAASGTFEFKNTSSEPLYLRAVTADLGGLQHVIRATLAADKASQSVESPEERVRFEFGEIALQAGQTVSLRLSTETRRERLGGLLFKNAYASDARNVASSTAWSATAFMLLAALALARYRRNKLAWAALALTTFLVGCGSGGIGNSSNGGSNGTTPSRSGDISIVQIEAVNSKGQFVRVNGLP